MKKVGIIEATRTDTLNKESTVKIEIDTNKFDIEYVDVKSGRLFLKEKSYSFKKANPFYYAKDLTNEHLVHYNTHGDK